MKIKEIILKDFKRFTGLTIQNLPKEARLVVLVGPNGCGKSSLFDAMNAYAKVAEHVSLSHYSTYYSKDTALVEAQRHSDIRNKIEISFHEAGDIHNKTFYIRSAYRHVPSFKESNINRIDENEHLRNRVPRLIETDQETSANYQRLIWRAANAVFSPNHRERKAGEIADEIISSARNYLEEVLPGLQLESLSDLESGAGTFTFSKGSTKNYAYENLSGGEKAAFDLLLDMAIKKETHLETIYCIDEPESHMGLNVQGNLLEALFDMLPSKSQLWIGSHSIGMLRKADELSRNHPGEIVFLDFSNKNFDEAQVIEPTTVNRNFWRRMHEVALDDMAKLTMPSQIILCESSPDVSFDAACYNQIFSSEYPDCLFISAGGKRELNKHIPILNAIAEGVEIRCIVDRDQMSDQQRESAIAQGKRVLTHKCIESYLLDDEVLQTFCCKHNVGNRFGELKELVDEANIKASAGNIRQYAINHFGCGDIGSDRNAFLRDSLAPLLKDGMSAYAQLRDDIFGNNVSATGQAGVKSPQNEFTGTKSGQ